MRAHFLPCLLVVLGCVFDPQLALPAVFNIPDGDIAALKNAIATSNTNGEDDTIELASNGTYTLTIIDNGDNGLPAVLSDNYSKLTIHGNGATIQRSTDGEVPLFRVFYVDFGADLSLSELTIANGALTPDTESFGGGIYNTYGHLSLNSCLLTNNQARHGAGIYSTFGELIITNSVISGNVAGGAYGTGGGVESLAEDITIVECTFSNNAAQSGGAIRNMYSSAASISGCSFNANHGLVRGGGVLNQEGTIMSVTDSVFDSNVSGAGAAIANTADATGIGGEARLTITHCSFANNSAGYGGAVYNYTQRSAPLDPGVAAILGVSDSGFANNVATYGGAIYSAECCGTWHGRSGLTAISSTFSGNSARDGGAIYVTPSASPFPPTSVTNSTFMDNTATNDGTSDPDVDGGGAIYCRSFIGASATMTVKNCTFSENWAPFHGGGIFLLGSDVNTKVFLNSTVLKTAASGESLYNSNGTITSDGYNLSNDNGGGFLTATGDQINTDPMVDPAGLQNNGGPTQTVALLPGSPAINSGDPNSPARDQRYYLRNGAPDKGAFEYGGTLSPLSVISRKNHGPAGTFDIDLPLDGNTGVECRSGGETGDHQLVMSFATPVTIGSANVTNGTGSVSSVNINRSEVTLNLTGVGNAQQIVLTVSNANDGVNSSNVIFPMRLLLGDTTADSLVQLADVNAVKSQIGQLVTSSNFRSDVNANGTINASDINVVKSQVGTSASAVSETKSVSEFKTAR